MPKLLLFVPCRNVLSDEEDNISPISIFSEVRIPSGDSVPVEARAAMQWYAVTLWAKLPEDEGRRYEEDVMLIGPDGGLKAHTKMQFSMSVDMHRNVSKIFGFPVGLAGKYSLQMKLKDMNDPSVFLQEHSFPLHMIHTSENKL